MAKEYGDLTNRRDQIGLPLRSNNHVERHFDPLIKAANVKRIAFHGMRHICASMLLQAGEPVRVVSKRLGHFRVEITLNTYAHVLLDMQKQAAATMRALLHHESDYDPRMAGKLTVQYHVGIPGVQVVGGPVQHVSGPPSARFARGGG